MSFCPSHSVFSYEGTDFYDELIPHFRIGLKNIYNYKSQSLKPEASASFFLSSVLLTHFLHCLFGSNLHEIKFCISGVDGVFTFV